jgi:amino acid adenylation domain-containing protein
MINGAYDSSKVQLELTYRSTCMDDFQAKTLTEALSKALQSIIAGPESLLSDLDLITDTEKQQIWNWNQNLPDIVERCIHDVFAENAKLQPDSPAICAWDGTLTYTELDQLSTSLAAQIQQKYRISPEDIVLLCFEKSMWTIVAMVAVSKAGGVFAPLDPDHPQSRHQDIIAQTNSKLILTCNRYLTSLEWVDINVLTVNSASIRSSANSRQLRSEASPSSAAYVIFTSGSTGKPKGVVQRHQSAVTSCLGHGKTFGLTSNTRFLQFATYTFDASITEIITTLLYGGCVCVPSEEDRRDNLARFINSTRVNTANLTPTVARLLNPNSVPTLKYLVLSGEQVNLTDWEAWNGHAQTINAYGPAECCVKCAAFIGDQDFKTGLIGKSIASVSWIASAQNHENLVPIGAIGELLVEGHILAREYLGDPEKSRAAFISNPRWLSEGSQIVPGRKGRLYKTGDLVRYEKSGNLVYIGRKDGQVKIRGQRVETGEIEFHIRESMPELEKLAVETFLPAGETTKAVLAAFLQLSNKGGIDHPSGTGVKGISDVQLVYPQTLDQSLAQRLPHHMVPNYYFSLAKLPTTTSGKINRKQLREIGNSFSAQELANMRKHNAGEIRRPSTDMERKLQMLWARVLNMEAGSIGLDDDFFDLGGDSVLAMKLVSEAREVNIRLTSANIIRAPRLCHLACLPLGFEKSSREETKPFSLIPTSVMEFILSDPYPFGRNTSLDNIEDVLPTTYFQNFSISEGVKSPDTAFNYLFIKIGPKLDVEKLKRSCVSLMRHLPMLRTQFAYLQGSLYQVVLRDIELPFAIYDIDSSSDQESNEICLQDLSATSPLSTPTRFMLLRHSSNKHQLIIRLSHAQYDGFCLPILTNKLISLYNDQYPGMTPEFSKFLAHIQSQNSSSVAHWQHVLKGSQPSRVLPHLKPQPGSTVAPQKIEAEKTIQKPTLPSNLTLSSVVSAAWALVLSQITGTDDVVFGNLLAGRDAEVDDISEIFGPCINVVPVRALVEFSRTSGDFIRSIRDQSANMGTSNSMGLHDIISQCTEWPIDSTLDSVIYYQGIEAHPEIEFAGATARTEWFDNPSIVLPHLGVAFYPSANQLKILINGHTDMLTAERAESLVYSICHTIEVLSDSLTTPLGSCAF